MHLPPSRVSFGTGEIDHMEPVRMADIKATKHSPTGNRPRSGSFDCIFRSLNDAFSGSPSRR